MSDDTRRVGDDRLGQAIALVLRGDRAREGELRRYLKSELPNFMQPARILWRAELPWGPNGKLDRERLRHELNK